jgi:RNA polymerase sigma factor (sigma-70 family)
VNFAHHQHTTDAELLNNFYTQQNNEWLGILLQRYTLLLFGVCMKYLKNEEEAKDAVQQICFKALNEILKHKVIYFKSWLYTVAKNYCLMQLRGSNRSLITELKEELIAPSPEVKPLQEHFYQEALLLRLTEAIEALGQEQKQCVTLFYLQKQSYQQIATSTNTSILQVKSHLQNAKRNLKNLMAAKMQQP